MPSEKTTSYLGARIALIAALVVACAGLLMLAKSRSVLTHLTAHTLPGVDMAGEIKQGPAQLFVRVLEYQASDAADAAELGRLRNDYARTAAEYSGLLRKYRNYRIGGPADEGSRRLEAVVSQLGEFDALARPLIGAKPDASFLELRNLDAAFRRFDTASDELFSFKWRAAGTWVDESVGYARCAIVMTAGLLVLMLVLFIGFLIRAMSLRGGPRTPRGLTPVRMFFGKPHFVWTRLFLGFGLMLCLAGFWFLAEARNSLNILDARTLPGLEIAGEIKQGPPQLYVPVLEYLAAESGEAGRAGIRRTYDEKYAEQLGLIAKYKVTVTSDEDGRRIDAYEARAIGFDAEARRFLSGSGRVTSAELRAFGAGFARFDDASDRLFDLKWQRCAMWVDLSVKNAGRAVLVTGFILILLLLTTAGVFARVWSGRLVPLTPDNF